MSLKKDLDVFFKNKQICIRELDIKNIVCIIEQTEGKDTLLNEFWQNMLKRSCDNNIFDTKKFTVLLEKTRFSEDDVKDFFDVEYSNSEDKEEKIKSILDIKENILGTKCTNIKFDLLLKDALWSLDINDNNFCEQWKSICNQVEVVEKEMHCNKEVNIINFKHNVESSCSFDQNYMAYSEDELEFCVPITGNIIYNV